MLLLLVLLAAGCKHQITTNVEPEKEAFAYITLHIKMGTYGLQASPDIDDDILDNLSFTVTAKDTDTNIYKRCHHCSRVLRLPKQEKKGFKHVKCPDCHKRNTFLILKSEKIEIIKKKKQ